MHVVVQGKPSKLETFASSEAECPDNYQLTGCSATSGSGTGISIQKEGNTCKSFYTGATVMENDSTLLGAKATAICNYLPPNVLVSMWGGQPTDVQFHTRQGKQAEKWNGSTSMTTCPEGYMITGCSCEAGD